MIMNRKDAMTLENSINGDRRRLMQALALGGVATGLGLWKAPAWALATQANPDGILAGNRFDLEIGQTPLRIGGQAGNAVTVNGTLPAPILRWREGEEVTLRVRNALAQTSSIHWHGILLPANMDGVPGLSFHGIAPGGDYLYRFKVKQNGTYWYHSHSSLQEQAGLYGALIIDPAQPEPFQYERDYVILLSDWTGMDPYKLFARLKKRPDYDNLYKRTVGDFFQDVRERGLSATLADRKAWGEMRMSPTDLADVNGNTYAYLANGRTHDDAWTGLFSPGERIRLRLVNAAAMSFFDVRIPGLKFTVVAADGQHVQPVEVEEFRIAPAALRGNMLRDRPTWEDFALWCQYDGDDDRLIGDTVDRWDFTEVYMNKTFGVTRLSVLRELLERFRRTEPSPENVQDVADALKRLSMEPRSEALRIAVIEQLRRVLR